MLSERASVSLFVGAGCRIKSRTSVAISGESEAIT